jgi:hypothetical protein
MAARHEKMKALRNGSNHDVDVAAFNKMKLCLASTTDLNTAIISKDECQKHDLARRVVPRG